MAGISVHVKPEIISWILNTVQFEEITGSAIELLRKWQTGEKIPTFHQLEDMSRKTKIPFGYFFLEKPPVEKCLLAEYRTFNSADVIEPSRNLIDTVDLMTDIQEWMVEYVTENGQEELGYVGSAAGITDPQIIVQDIRKKMDINVSWYADSQNAGEAFRIFRRKLENLHILVMMSGIVGNNTRRKLNVDEFRAFTLVNKFAPLIFINSCDSDTGKLFSIAHELVHVWIGKNSFYNAKNSEYFVDHGIESICNAAAAELLVPTEFFGETWNNCSGAVMERIEKTAKAFRCSRFVVARKAFDCGKISQNVYNQIIRELTETYKAWQEKQKADRNSGGNYYRNLASKMDLHFVAALARSTSEGRTQYTEAYRLTNTNRKTFGKLLEEIGGVG